MRPRYRWWQRDTTTSLDGYGPLPDHGHETCLHRQYQLSCRQFEQLLRRSGGNCETCELPGYRNVHGKLFIDHDHHWGRWAVRGLLCWDCNNAVEHAPFSAAEQAYLDNAWYLGLLAERGVALAYLPEPDDNATVIDHTQTEWRHRSSGRYRPTVSPHHQRKDRSWSWLMREVGPHNLHVIGATTC